MSSDASPRLLLGINFGGKLLKALLIARVPANLCLKAKFQQGMQQWRTQGREQWVGLIPPATDEVGYLTFEAYMHQMDIGWDQATFCGGFGKNWRLACILAYCQERNHTDIAQVDHGWCERLITRLWHMGTESWFLRNSELFVKSAEEQHTKQLRDMDDPSNINMTYQIRTDDRNLFLLLVDVRIRRYNLIQKILWVETVGPRFQRLVSDSDGRNR